MEAGGVASAATVTWDGEGGVWFSVAANWSGDVVPVAGDALVFSGNGSYLASSGALYTGAVVVGATNDLAAGTVFNGISFDSRWQGNRVQGNQITLGGDIANGHRLIPQIISAPLALNATRTVDVSSQFSTLTLSGIVSETVAGSGLTKTGSGLLVLSAVNTYTGAVAVNGGTLSIGADTGLGTVPGAATPASITLNGGALRSTASITLNANRGIALGASGGTIDANNAIVYNGILAGSGGLVKTGANTLTLGAASSYTGTTTVNQGILKLDFSQAGAPASNILGGALVLDGLSSALNGSTSSTTANPTLNVTSGSALANSQTFSGTTINGGQQSISTTQTAGGTVLLNLGAITHNAGVVNFSLAGAFSSGVNAITTTTANAASGILGGWASINGADYAANDGANNLVAYTGYVVLGNAATIGSLATSNVQTQATGAIGLSTANAATTDINTLSSSTASTGAKTVTVGTAGTGSTGVLRLGADGGLLLGSGSGTLTIGNVANNGTLTAGGADNTAGVLHLINHSTAGNLTINSKIADNGTGAVSLRVGTYATPAINTVLTLNGTNTFTGGIVLNGGRLAGTPAGFSSGAITVRNGAQAYLTGTGTYTNDFNLAGNGTNTADTNSALRFQGNSVSGKITLIGDTNIALRNSTGNAISGQITGGYNLTITGAGATGGNITLSNTANNWTGNFTVDTETVKLGASEVIPNGSGAGSVIVTGNAASILDLNGFNETINGLAATGANGFIQNSAASTTSTLTIGDAGISSQYEGVIRDNAGTGGVLALVKTGAGNIQLAGNNTFTGGVTVKAGILYGGTGGAASTPFGAVTSTLTLGDTTGTASATLRQSNTGKTLAHPITVVAGSSGTKTLDTLGGGQTFTYSGAVTLNDSVTVATYAGNSNVMALSGAITGTGAVNIIGLPKGGNVNISGVVAGANTGIVMSGTGTMVLSGQSTFTGAVTVNSGTLQGGASAVNNGTTGPFGNVSAGGRSIAVNTGGTLLFSSSNVFGNNTVADSALPAIAVNGGTLRTTRYATVGELDLSNGATVTNTATDTGNYQSLALRGAVVVSGSAASSIVATATSATQYGYHLGASTSFSVADVTGSSATDLTISAALRNQSGDFANAAGGLTKSGAGTMALTGANTYTGATTVSAGTLLVDGSTAAGSAVSVAASGTLGGTGTVGGAVTAAGKIAPGDTGTGTLTTGNAALTGTLAVQVDGAATDKLQVNGNLDLTGATLNVSVLGGGFTAASYVIAEYTGTLTGTFASVPSGYAVAYNAGTGGKQLILTQVASAYNDWATSNLLDGTNNGPSQDPDHDGISNLLEFVLGGNPLSASSDVLPVQMLDNDYLWFMFSRNGISKTDSTLVVQWSTDMATWTDIAVGIESSGDGTVTVSDPYVTVKIPRTHAVNGRLFARLKATR
ncbi:hypothetical protein llg_25720 [Luteolibacter sp. LG18]|nr:hypothetical protein llg_25720 [Luteolibacter sp. LG18]